MGPGERWPSPSTIAADNGQRTSKALTSVSRGCWCLSPVSVIFISVSRRLWLCWVCGVLLPHPGGIIGKWGLGSWTGPHSFNLPKAAMPSTNVVLTWCKWDKNPELCNRSLWAICGHPGWSTDIREHEVATFSMMKEGLRRANGVCFYCILERSWSLCHWRPHLKWTNLKVTVWMHLNKICKWRTCCL